MTRKPKAKARKHQETWYALKQNNGSFLDVKKHHEHLIPISSVIFRYVKIVKVRITES